MIDYKSSLENLDELDFEGFFVDWPNPPNVETFKKILSGSYRFVLATDEKKVVGFINAVSDGVLSAYIPLLEVLPEYQSKGIGKELVLNMKRELSHLYMIDLLCDENLIPYYENLGMQKATGVFVRNYENQNGES